VNAWGGYKMARDRKKALKNLIRVLKSWHIPKELAMQIIQASKQKEVEGLIDSHRP